MQFLLLWEYNVPRWVSVKSFFPPYSFQLWHYLFEINYTTFDFSNDEVPFKHMQSLSLNQPHKISQIRLMMCMQHRLNNVSHTEITSSGSKITHVHSSSCTCSLSNISTQLISGELPSNSQVRGREKPQEYRDPIVNMAFFLHWNDLM